MSKPRAWYVNSTMDSGGEMTVPGNNSTDHLSPTIYSNDGASVDVFPDSFLKGADGLLRSLLVSSVIRRHDWDQLESSVQDELVDELDDQYLLEALMSYRLLTSYQAERIRTGKTFGLVLGHYRILNPLGRGSMGQVYKAEHIRLPRQVAIKVQTVLKDASPDLQQRFENEAWTMARLQHRNIVAAVDAGDVINPHPGGERLLYFVMEFVPGLNLEEAICARGVLSKQVACNLIYQAASALQETDRHGLVHRDIKPSNIVMTPEGTAKLLDFGLSRQYDSNLTRPGAWLGTIDYLAPEQAQDASAVDIRADIYSLGSTLYWCLTGQKPFASSGRAVEDFLRRSNQPPPSILEIRPELPEELAGIVAKMMAVQPGDRYQTPADVMAALLPFMERRSESRAAQPAAPAIEAIPVQSPSPSDPRRKPRVLVVDDEPTVRKCVRLTLVSEGVECHEAANGEEALELLGNQEYDLVLTDIEMPIVSGLELLRKIRNQLGLGHLKVLVFSGRSSPNELAKMMAAGADDYLVKPLSLVQLRSRVNAALRLKESQDAAVALNRRLFEAHQEMAESLSTYENRPMQEIVEEF